MNPTDHLLLNRRHALKSLACGFGYLALAGMTQERAVATAGNPLAVKPTHHLPKAKRVIFLFMQGGPSHVDTFDYKPLLAQQDGQMRDFDDARTLARTGTVTQHRVMKNMWPFAQHGECGRWVSTLFPHQARHVDDLCFLH